VKKIPEEIYRRIDNNIYNLEGDRWWQTDFSLNLIRTLLNPLRVDYANKIIEQIIKKDPAKTSVLEVGCGGGILSEEIAGLGFITTGIDPSESSLRTAAEHSVANKLLIKYVNGYGEDLPFGAASFDVVLCCDVLEHVRDLPKVISEISRVLKNGGVFIYDTFNRTYFSKISAIKILQDWKRWSIMPTDLHVWEMFIKPEEIRSLLEENHLSWKEHRGAEPNISYIKMLHYLHKRAIGKLTYAEFGSKFRMAECRSTRVMYMGYAVKA
jgi:2-polyprenyl-6-hydroxyphenyl methylase/3-demethylubiquinone-9 3-methyltransferase